MIGGIVADFASNPEIAVLPENVQAGVRLHRMIDGFTDRHPTVHRSIGRISSRLGWFAGIVIDIYYDHLLIRNWDRYALEPLGTFAKRAYRTLETLLPIAPISAKTFLRRFIDNDHIGQYASVEGLTKTLARVSQRIHERIPKRAIWLPTAIPDLIAVDDGLVEDFQSFYPELIAFAEQSRTELGDKDRDR